METRKKIWTEREEEKKIDWKVYTIKTRQNIDNKKEKLWERMNLESKGGLVVARVELARREFLEFICKIWSEFKNPRTTLELLDYTNFAVAICVIEVHSRNSISSKHFGAEFTSYCLCNPALFFVRVLMLLGFYPFTLIARYSLSRFYSGYPFMKITIPPDIR